LATLSLFVLANKPINYKIKLSL